MERRDLSLGKKLIFSLLSVLLFFGLLEGGARALISFDDSSRYDLHRNIITILGLPAMNEIMEYDARLFWTLKKNLRGRRITGNLKEWPVDFGVTTNGLGLRGAAVGPKRKFRILAVGNSCTFGVGVNDDETWPARLERIMREESGVESEVINAGVPGYSSFQGRRYLEERGLDLEPDLVIACFGFNDIDAWGGEGDDAAMACRVAGAAWERALSRSALFRGMSRLLKGGGEPAAGERLLRVDSREMRENIAEMNRTCAERGARLMLLIWPFRNQREKGNPAPILFQAVLLQTAREEEIPVVNLIEPFLAPEETPFLDHIHANTFGCDVAAHSIADLLELARVR